MLRRLAAFSVVGVLCAATACGGSSKPAATNWDPSALTQLKATSALLAKAFPGDCANFQVLGHRAYLAATKRFKSAIPLAVGHCTASGEDVEISVFSSPKARDAFVKARTKSTCSLSAKVNGGLVAQRWVTGGDWSMEPDTEGGARRIAAKLGAAFTPIGCPGIIGFDWSDTDAARVSTLASQLTTAHLGCTDAKLQDRDKLLLQKEYAANGLPGAYAKCTLPDGSTALVASFDDTQTQAAQWLPTEQQHLCASNSTLRAAVGRDWIVFLPAGTHVDEVARALHGTTDPHTCRA